MPKETGNKISVWHIEENRSNLNRVAAAIASGRSNIANLDYALFQQETVNLAGITVREAPGETADDGANTQWHRDLIELTANKLVRLAKEMYSEAEIVRMQHLEVSRLVRQGIDSKKIQQGRLKDSLVKDLS